MTRKRKIIKDIETFLQVCNYKLISNIEEVVVEAPVYFNFRRTFSFDPNAL